MLAWNDRSFHPIKGDRVAAMRRYSTTPVSLMP